MPAGVISGWSEAEVSAWCSRTEVPVPTGVVSGWSEAADVAAFILVDEGAMIGYGALWIDDDGAEVELARLIIEPGHRGRGYGRRMVTELVTRAREHHQSVILRVHPDNVAAQRRDACRPGLDERVDHCRHCGHPAGERAARWRG